MSSESLTAAADAPRGALRAGMKILIPVPEMLKDANAHPQCRAVGLAGPESTWTLTTDERPSADAVCQARIVGLGG
jgi:hypothetical protein